MQLRRALLLFAIVLGVAAVGASLAPAPQPRDERLAERPAESEPPRSAPAPPVTGPRELRFEVSDGEPARHELAAGRHAVMTVAAEEPGEVAIAGLGLTGYAVPGTPAVFDVIPEIAGRYEIDFTPVEGRARTVGLLVVEPPS